MPTEQQLESAKKKAVEICESQRLMPGRLARNLIGVEIDIKVKDAKPLGYKCVCFYVERKIEPEKTIDPRLRIPKQLGEAVDTDVIETRRFVSFQSHAPKLKAAPGSSIGLDYDAPNVDATRLGTLGAFLDIGGTVYVLGANHVMAVNGRVPTGTPILFRPPGKFANPGEYVLARKTVHIPLSQPGPNLVDCALAEVIDQKNIKMKIETYFPKGIVVASGEMITPKAGMKVVRVDVDRKEQAKGVIKCVGCKAQIDFRFGAFDFDDMVLIEGENGEFANPGDSGALIVDLETNQVTAMLVGGSRKYAIASPLSTVYKLLEEALAEHNVEQAADAAEARAKKRAKQVGEEAEYAALLKEHESIVPPVQPPPKPKKIKLLGVHSAAPEAGGSKIRSGYKVKKSAEG